MSTTIAICLARLPRRPDTRHGAGVERRDFHISRAVRDKYGFDASLFSLSGNVILADYGAVRDFVQRIHCHPDQALAALRPGSVHALGLIDEILHFVVGLYREQKKSHVLAQALSFLQQQIGRKELDRTLRRFVDEFPGLDVFRGEVTLDDFLAGRTGTTSNREIILEEMLLLWLANQNPAFAPFGEWFADEGLKLETAYERIMELLHRFFDSQPVFGPDRQNLVEMLRSPAVAFPDSLSGQLDFIRRHWGLLIGRYAERLLRGFDFIREDDLRIVPQPEKHELEVPAFYHEADETAESVRYSPDREWMPRLVLLAKSIYVWLDQLAKKYSRPIRRLDEIPDSELDRLARSGFSGLWLIGIWERSPASQTIKRRSGNPEALASAYALKAYRIAVDLGGETAFADLKRRAAEKGIRMACDMVPNHTGIDSEWVNEHPDWFIQTDQPPFSSYSFAGPDLSDDSRTGIFIEDHYYDRSDAAVVFRRLDRSSGDNRFLFHGNDGTRMPWNDTAQLNYLLGDVREAVINTILEVARRFPIIRFDAAMTLAKRHYQRLWFPEPGKGGDIPSRSAFGLSRADFNRLMPREFWREVVERAAREAPDTLLLAEAFWLMEGYFVRTLGMHRVYNSAFMNFLKSEDNAKFRQMIRNVLEFDPEIMKRFVNFLSNPDEETAVAQFGKDDKYFGACTLMATLPGLPMFGHGQVEGFAEKYGMEYSRAYRDESEDPSLVARHEREIFPLLRQRHAFSQVDSFFLYDFRDSAGDLDEDVIAYSNRGEDQASLVVFHNRYSDVRGWLRDSLAVRRGSEQVRKNLGEALGLSRADGCFVVFRDHVSELEFIRSGRELWEMGLYVELGAFKYHVFLDFREVIDTPEKTYEKLHAALGGRGVRSVGEARRDMERPIQQRAQAALLDPVFFRRLIADPPAVMPELRERLAAFPGTRAGATDPVNVLNALNGLFRAKSPEAAATAQPAPTCRKVLAQLKKRLAEDESRYLTLWAWGLAVSGAVDPHWNDALIAALAASGIATPEARRLAALADILVDHSGWCARLSGTSSDTEAALGFLFADAKLQKWIGVHEYQGVLWFRQEAFEELLDMLLATAYLKVVAGPASEASEASEAGADYPALDACQRFVQRARELAFQLGFRLTPLINSSQPKR